MTTKAAGYQGAAERWRALSIVEQLAHVGSEVERAIRARERGATSRLENAVARALELFDLTVADDRWRGPRRREVLRAREEFCRLVYAGEAEPASVSGLRSYFLAFAVAARNAPADRPPSH